MVRIHQGASVKPRNLGLSGVGFFMRSGICTHLALSDRGSTTGDFKAAGCPLVRAGKMNQREAYGLALVRTMLQAAGRDLETPWLLWTKACEGLIATWPTALHPRDVERIADDCENHSLDAVRCGVQWWRAKWKVGKGPWVW